MIINIQDDVLKLHALGLLDGMLLDKTTKQHIMWATGAYASLGGRYEYNGEITPDLITGEHASVIKTRARKAMEQQSARTRQHAEVFTPLWMCRMMNDYADKVWFGRKEVFFKDGTPTAAVEFPKGKKWERYVDSRRLEITCGEAPYLVSRYDVETGEAIPIRERAGLLDRKLRVVGENTQTEEEWLEWTMRAFWATYGYEFQGDNVLIARVNLLMTFEEYLQERWKRKPTRAEYERIANIITWNIWQMDGLTGTVPYGTLEGQFQQMDLFGMFGESGDEDKKKQPRCLVHNWTGGGSVEFLSLPVKGKKAMKFDFIIGNPPYQEEIEGSSDRPIYNAFMDAVYKISDKAELITPARFLFNAGKTPKAWNQKMMEDTHLGEPYEGITQTFISIGAFESEFEAQAALKYVKSKFTRTLLGILKITQHNPGPKWKYVPLQDFTQDSDIDWSKSIPEIDQQLYKKYGLDEKEIQFIESHVKEMA